MNKSLNYIIFVFVLIVIISEIVAATSSSQDSILARVNDDVITLSSFESYYSKTIKTLGLNDNLSNRTKILTGLLNDYVLINYARQNGLANDKVALSELSRIKIQELLNQYSEVFISPKILVAQNDLMEIYHRMNTKIKVSHIYSNTKQAIDSAYTSLLNGAQFDSLASSLFSDPELRRKNGLIGYITFDEMDPAFEAEAYSLMVGGISKPIKTAYGYSIIRVDDKISTPVITENEFNNKKDDVYRFARKKKYEKYIKNFSDSLSSELILSFDDDVVNELFAEVKNQNVISELSMQEEGNYKSKILNKIIVETINGNWNVEQLLSAAQFTSDTQKKFVRNTENLKEFISGLIVREHLISEARKNNLDRNDIYAANIKKKFEDYLIKRVTQSIKNDIVITETEIEDYYKSNIKQYEQPEQFRLSAILLDDKSKINELKIRIDNGEDFGALAQNYSLQSKTAVQNGDMGFFNKTDLVTIDSSLNKIKPNEVVGPITNENKYLFVKCTEIMDAYTIPIESLKEKIIVELKGLKLQDQKEEIVKEYSKNLSVSINIEKLKTLNLND
jgi:parvulin-like peptidyl-prolyl isomerase